MSARVASLFGSISCCAIYYMIHSGTSQVDPLTVDQKQTRRIRSHLSGNHPAVAGGDDCLSRKFAQLRSHASAESCTGETDTRRHIRGTVSHFTM